MASALKVTYDQMDDACSKAEGTAKELEDLMRAMNQYIGFLCDNWEADASQAYRDDFAAIANSVMRTSETVNELTATVRKYVAEVQELDKAYAGTKISVN